MESLIQGGGNRACLETSESSPSLLQRFSLRSHCILNRAMDKGKMRNRLIHPKCLATMCPCVMYIALPNSTDPARQLPSNSQACATLEATPGHQLPNKSLWSPTRLGKPQIKSMSLRRSCDRKRQVVRMTGDIEIFISYIHIYIYTYIYIYIYSYIYISIHNHTYIILYLLHHTIYLRYMSLCMYIYIIIYIYTSHQ